MTAQVLQNEITELAPSHGLREEQRRTVAEALAGPLADAFRLSINLRALHWNVEGPLFYSVHKLTEEQYEAMTSTIDEFAERIRALGLRAPQTLREFQEQSDIDDLPDRKELKARIDRVVEDYERAVARMAVAAELAEKHSDIKTADLLTEKIGDFEENAWMLRATTA